tara:strand:+ start:169 stop:768 length:600 start_codon:yes stop_codon:yes gene_type:complete
MKKIILLSFIFSLTLNFSAQDFGIKGGSSFSYYAFGGDEDTENTMIYNNPGFILGGFTQFGQDNIRVTTELLFIQKGSQQELNFNYPLSPTTIRGIFNYIESNAMCNFYISDNSSLNAGVYIAYLTQAAMIVDDSPKEDLDLDVYTDIVRSDFGINVGASIYVTDFLQLDARYGYGLSSVSESFETFNRTIQLTCGLKF